MPKANGKGKGYEKKDKDPASDVSYNRDILLQLGISSAAMKKSPSPGSLHTRTVEQIGESSAARPRAASDSKHPEVRHNLKATTVMLKNIPVEYSRTGLCEEVATLGFGYAIDFLYLPIDSSTGLNIGHAFVNVRSKDALRDFKRAFHGVPAISCLPAYDSAIGLCEVSVAEVQGRDAHMQKLCTAANLNMWKNNDEWQPLFLDDYGTKIPLVQWVGNDAPGLGPRPRSNSECNNGNGKPRLGSSPEFKHKASPVFKHQQQPQTKASPSLRAEAKEFSPSIVPESQEKAEATVLTSSMRAQAAPFSPSLRADANEFVPSGMVMPEMLPEPALVD